MLDMWHQLEFGLERDGFYIPGFQDIAADAWGKEDPYISLLVAVIIQTGKDSFRKGKYGNTARKFLASKNFDVWCTVSGLSPWYVKSAFKLVHQNDSL